LREKCYYGYRLALRENNLSATHHIAL